MAIAPCDARDPEVRRFLERHDEFTRAHSPPQDIHALDEAGLLDASVTLFVLRQDGEPVATGALKQLDAVHGELKTMHTLEELRGRGFGSAMLGHLVATARERGYQRLSLETGSMAAFAAARSLYARAGFEFCEPFGDYAASPNSTFMTMAL